MKTKIEQITLEEIAEELKREIKVRERVYPRWIESGRLDAREADLQILKLRAALAFVEAELAKNRAQGELFQMKNKNLSGNLLAARPSPLTVRETPLSAQIAEWLETRGIYNDRLNCGKVRTESGHWITLCKAGTPDRFAVLRGRIVFIEVKRRGEKPTLEQTETHEKLRESGAIVLVADSFDEFEGKFKAIRAAVEAATATREVKETKLYD